MLTLLQHELQKIQGVQEVKNAIKQFEAKHTRQIQQFKVCISHPIRFLSDRTKVAVLYARPGQTMDEIWSNRPGPSSAFYGFLESIATRIDLRDWIGYRGDMGSACCVLLNKWSHECR